MFLLKIIIKGKFLLLMYFSSIVFGFSQPINNLNFSSWSKEDGLPSNYINAIEKDKLGFLWIATNDGLCRYNGPNSIKIYQYIENGDSTKTRLQSNNIRSLLCDSKGYLWIGTINGGLTRFNPSANEWITFQNDALQKNSLSNDEVLSIIEDSKQRIWVGTEDGLNLFDRTTETFTQFKLDDTPAKVTTARAVLSIMEDDKGWIWAGTWAGGLHLLLEDENGNYNFKQIRYFETTQNKAANNVWVLDQDSEGRYWLGTHGGGVLLMNLPENASNRPTNQNWQPGFYKFTFKVNGIESIGSNTIQAILQDKFENLWIGTGHGLFKINHQFLSAENANEKELLKTFDFFLPSDDGMTIIGDNIKNIFEDDQGLIWLGTDGGLNQFNYHSNQFKSFNFSDDYFTMPHAPSIYVDSTKNIWIGMPQHGIQKFRIENEILKKIDNPINNLLLGKRVSTIYCADGRWMYIGTELGITAINLYTWESIKYPTPPWLRSKIQNLFIQTILVDSKGSIWFGTNVGLFKIDANAKTYTLFEPDFKKPNSISDNSINQIIEDSQGSIWIATYKGLNKITDISSDEVIFEKFFYNSKQPSKGLSNNQVLYLKEINNNLYIGTKTGICFYNFLTREFNTLQNNDYNFSISSIEEGVNNDFWVSTSEGIFNYNYQEKSFRMFNKKDGLNNTAYRLGNSFKDIDDNIYFVYTNGFNYFSPSTFLSNEIAPPVYITEVEIMNRDTTQLVGGMDQKEIELNHDDYRLSIDYVALNYNRADKNKYIHRLAGLEENWSEIKFGTPIVYTNLKPKAYRLEIKAANNDGVWNEKGDFITIIQHPPYWETWWFRLLTVLLVAAIILSLFLLYTNKIRKHNEELQIYNQTLSTEITNRIRVEQKLQHYNSELMRSNNDLEQFAYITSHDLKEPLRVVLSFSNLLSQKYINKLDDNASKYIKFIDDGVRRMTSLVDSLLTYSIVGQKDSVYNSFNLNKLIKGKVSDLSQLIKDKNAIVKIKDLPEIIGHQEQIGMVFFNLINNALKFNNQEQPIIVVKEDESYGEYWKFSVKDNGIGIEAQYQKQIFGIFKRLHNKKEYEGTGIGLSVCQKIIQRHKGDIWLQSNQNKGTTFFFTIKKNLMPVHQLSEA